MPFMALCPEIYPLMILEVNEISTKTSFTISLPQVEYMYVGRYVYIVCQLMDKVFNAAGIYTFAAPKQLQSLSLL